MYSWPTFRLIYLTVLVTTCFVACKSTKSLPKVYTRDMQELFGLMQGTFDSQAQALRDSNYYNISLHMTPIWMDRGRYLYVEQALATMQDKPYRQRIYELIELDNGKFESKVYELVNPEMYVGKWRESAYFNNLDRSILLEREGCSVFLTRIGDEFIGSTVGQNCKSSLRGASYAVSKVIINSSGINSWDQGFDDNNVQVWGAVKGGYEFRKTASF